MDGPIQIRNWHAVSIFSGPRRDGGTLNLYLVLKLLLLFHQSNFHLWSTPREREGLPQLGHVEIPGEVKVNSLRTSAKYQTSLGLIKTCFCSTQTLFLFLNCIESE